jgi:hypothetical protein
VSEQQKSLGQVAYEALWQAQRADTGCGIPPWPQPLEVKSWQRWWEAAGEAVKAAVLAEQAEPQGTGGMAEQELWVRQVVVQAISTMLGNAFDVRLARVLTVAIEEGVLTGLKAWEAYR